MKGKLVRFALAVVAMCGFAAVSASVASQHRARFQSPQVTVEANGTVLVPSESVPLSSFLTPAGKSYMTQHLQQMQQPHLIEQVQGVPRFMQPFLKRDNALFAVSRADEQIGGVHVYVYVPKSGISLKNSRRVLINLHGGGFSGCWPGCAELESIPVSALMKIKVVTVDYREGPKYKFPAASQDVASVYRELLKTYDAKEIGIYGCSAGGMLTAESEAWFQAHSLPSPGAIGIYCAGAGGFGGDSLYMASPTGEARMPSAVFGRAPDKGVPQLGYFDGTTRNDPLVTPLDSPEILARFPPTLIITADRDIAMSDAIYTHEQLVKQGVDAELHVWEGLFHGFFYNADVPESRDAFNVMIHFFDRHLGQ
jgi:monoterpene epsilon-lactone hydrolase